VKKSIQLTVLILILFSLAGCSALIPPSDPTSPPNTNQEDAQKALVEFFRLLHDGDYQGAADMYAGSYEWLIEINPDLPADAHARLLEQGCQFNGLMCLEVLNAEPVLMFSSTAYQFKVEFQLEDGSLFVLGPCCGADETEMPPVSTFQYRVQQVEDGSWKVMDMPQYVP
jgi:predicted small lipoprotein YifL